MPSKIVGWVGVVFGIILVLWGLWIDLELQWISHPEKTHRLLWVEHTWRLLAAFTLDLCGLLFISLGLLVKDYKRGD